MAVAWSREEACIVYAVPEDHDTVRIRVRETDVVHADTAR